MIRNVLRGLYTETILTLIRILAVPHTGLCLADRTQIDVVVLTGNQCYIIVLLQSAHLTMISYNTQRIRDQVHGVRIDFVLRHHQLIEVSIPTCVPSNVDNTCSLVGNSDVMRYGTLRCRTHKNTIQHDTTTQIIRSFERNLIGLIHLRQFQFYLLPVGGCRTELS